MGCKRRRCKYTVLYCIYICLLCRTCRSTNIVLYFVNFQAGDAETESKSWFELGKAMGVVVVSREDEAAEELTEEDKEVQRLMNKGLETKRKAVKGMLNLSD